MEMNKHTEEKRTNITRCVEFQGIPLFVVAVAAGFVPSETSYLLSIVLFV
jgi:hypothetical protein